MLSKLLFVFGFLSGLDTTAFAEGLHQCEFKLNSNWDQRSCYSEYREEKVRFVEEGGTLDVFVDVSKTCEDHRDTSYEEKYSVKLISVDLSRGTSSFQVSIPTGVLTCQQSNK